MGNKTCCQEQPRKQFTEHITIVHKHPTETEQNKAKIPELPEPIMNHLDKQKPYYSQLPSNPKVIDYEGDIFEGNVDDRGRPQGFGRMYKKNGSVFIGQFESGIANGDGHYVKPDGSYYHGRIFKNKTDDHNGYYWGGFKQNQFHGDGKQTGASHSFEGFYQHGTKDNGIMIWKQGTDNYQYQGSFNQDGKFAGKGKLKHDKGQYIGDFANGKKHGKGTFYFKQGFKYVGEYYQDIKDGQGKLFNSKGTLSYEGRFKNGLPDGSGKTLQKGKYVEAMWKEGIDIKDL